MLYVHALSPLHSGIGQSTGVIDLPVARETTTNWPYLPGSTIKGILRDACEPPGDADPRVKPTEAEPERQTWEELFGPPTVRASEGAGRLWFTDARLLCLPVRSYYGTFAWVTCPLALQRWAHDHRTAGLTSPDLPTGRLQALTPETIVVAQGSALVPPGEGAAAVLEDLDLALLGGPNGSVTALAKAIAAAAIADAAWRAAFVPRFGIVANDVFAFLSETATEVIARVRLNPATKTTDGGALWYEEVVPPEALFAGPLLAEGRGKVAHPFAALDTPLGATLQLGGEASIGRGLVRLSLKEGE